MLTRELEYDLPEGLIARHPPASRDGGRLLVIDRATGEIQHARIVDLPSLLPAPSTLVVNDTRVIPARLRGTKPSGGKCEVFLLRALDGEARRWEALARASHKVRPGTDIAIGPGLHVHIDARRDDGGFEVTLVSEADPWTAIQTHGEVPLPPYMHRVPDDADRERYQTVYARAPGAVAAPTAGLHLSATLLEALEARGVVREHVTLHVGAGTFAPVEVEDLSAHAMHREHYAISDEVASRVRSAKAAGRPIVAVGTTSVRALESWGGTPDGALAGDTRLLITPGYTFRLVDVLLTNFHLPRSTLLALVMAFAGVETTRRAYREAIDREYRFYSYGDACLIR